MRHLSSGIIILMVSLTVFLTGCDAPSKSSDTQNSVQSMEDLKIPANFDWKTTKDITFRLNGYTTGRVRILDKGGVVYHQANLIEAQEYSVKLSIPAYLDDLKVVYRGQEVSVNTTRSNFVHTFKP